MILAPWRIWLVLGVLTCAVIAGSVYAVMTGPGDGLPRAAQSPAPSRVGGLPDTLPDTPPDRPGPAGRPRDVAPMPEAPATPSLAPPRREGKLKVVATVSMLGDMVHEIGGERIQLTTLMGAGVDPHLYRPTRTDISAILDADVVFYNGLFLEGKMTEALLRAANAGKVIVPVGERIDQSRIIHPHTDGTDNTEDTRPVEEAGNGGGHADPHIWMDPDLWAQCIPLVRDELTKADPNGMFEFRARAEQYDRELAGLREYAASVLATVPEQARVLVTAHDAFSYFGRRYGFEVVGIQGISTESEAGVRDVERIVSLLVERKIKAVFVESTVSERNVRALIDGARRQGHEVVIGGSLFSDAMGPGNDYTGTYVGMIDHNVTTICVALGGKASERGWRNRLPATRPEKTK